MKCRHKYPVSSLMDTAYRMSEQSGRLGFARVLVEVKPDLCEHCFVFGHGFKNCKARDKTKEEIESERMRKNINANRGNKDGFMEVKE
ncbi:hypothetical protein Tco_0216953 [Tanacetum coccineum]